MFAPGSKEDPFSIPVAAYTATSWPSGRTPFKVKPGCENTGVFIGVGQSNISASENSNYSVTNIARIGNLNIFDGGVYAAQDPLLGTSKYSAGGCWLSRFADKLIGQAKYDRIIIVPIGIGSTSVSQWAAGGVFNRRILVAARRCEALGYGVAAFLWAQGETDHGMAQATYSTALQSVIATPRAGGFNAPWLIGKSTYTQGVTDTAVRSALASVVNGTDIFAGADTDDIGSTYRHDNTHYNATGADTVAGRWAAAVSAAI
jgi:hypothetical protein